MTAIITYSAATLLMVMGVVYLTERLCKWLWKPSAMPRTVTVIPVSGEVENIEQVVRFVQSYVNWVDSSHSGGGVILLDMGLEESTLQVCHILCRGHEEVILCKPEELYRYL